MRDYKDETIARLCELINYIEDSGVMLDEDKEEYYAIINEYQDEREATLVAEKQDNFAHRYSDCYILKDTKDGEVIVKAFDKKHREIMMREVSKHICFNDCDDTFEIFKIIYRGREIRYSGWLPNMEMQYEYVDTGDYAWSECFPQWDH